MSSYTPGPSKNINILVSQVLKKLKEYEIAVALHKSIFHARRLEFLGYVLTPEGISMSPEKVEDVLGWASPKSVKDVQIFMGFTNFYRTSAKMISLFCCHWMSPGAPDPRGTPPRSVVRPFPLNTRHGGLGHIHPHLDLPEPYLRSPGAPWTSTLRAQRHPGSPC
jgi:hypothetical protein